MFEIYYFENDERNYEMDMSYAWIRIWSNPDRLSEDTTEIWTFMIRLNAKFRMEWIRYFDRRSWNVSISRMLPDSKFPSPRIFNFIQDFSSNV